MENVADDRGDTVRCISSTEESIFLAGTSNFLGSFLGAFVAGNY